MRTLPLHFDRREITQAQSELDATAARLARAFPGTNADIQSTVAGYALSILGVTLLWAVLEASNPPYWIQLTTDALVLSALGLHAVTAYSVKQRTHEIGVRLALGAAPQDIWWLVLRRVMMQLGVGLVLGLPVAFIVGRLPWMSPDPLILMSIVLALAAVVGAACFFPARRATRLDPVGALRYE
jgi:hypothetical protein